ncbi:MAG: hypothetical protein NZM35_00285 [Chitinophagales bacterium]|nr:hypothetical protein [Chitinophagales bacterium]MDW8417882.1 hypothetical protein [Chitinophagales bacterium]
MRLPIIVFLALVMLAQTFVQTGVVFYYQINKAYITRQLCVNRQNPNNTCNGRCYLTRQLKQCEESEKKQSRIFYEMKENLYVACLRLPKLVIPYHTSTSFTENFSAPILNGHIHLPVKPPTA